MDYKYMMSERAEEIAYDEYNMDFHDLPPDVQAELFERAINDTWDVLLSLADGLERGEYMKAEVIEKTIAYGKNRYRVLSTGKWQVLMYGCWPEGNGKSTYRWASIPEDKVPEPVKQKGSM